MEQHECSAITATPGPATKTEDIEDEQTNKFSNAVGLSLAADVTADLHEYLCDARPHKPYESHNDVRFIYEIVYKDGWRERVKQVVDSWVENESNINRASAQVGRRHQKSQQTLLRGYCVFRLKAFDGNGWTTALDSLGIDQHEPQTVVFIALQDLDSTNGFFMSLRKGYDVCFDSRASVRFPSTGKGMGIFIALNL